MLHAACRRALAHELGEATGAARAHADQLCMATRAVRRGSATAPASGPAAAPSPPTSPTSATAEPLIGLPCDQPSVRAAALLAAQLLVSRVEAAQDREDHLLLTGSSVDIRNAGVSATAPRCTAMGWARGRGWIGHDQGGTLTGWARVRFLSCNRMVVLPARALVPARRARYACEGRRPRQQRLARLTRISALVRGHMFWPPLAE